MSVWGDTGCTRLRLPNAPFLFPRFGVPCTNALTEFAFTVRTGVGLPSSQVAYTSSAADLRAVHATCRLKEPSWPIHRPDDLRHLSLTDVRNSHPLGKRRQQDH